MNLSKGFLGATALSTVLVLTGCGSKEDENDNHLEVVRQSSIQSTTISKGDILSTLEDGIHQLHVPASVSGAEEDQIHVIVKDYGSGYRRGFGYTLNLGTFSDNSPNTETDEITVKTIETGDFITNLDDGISELKVDGGNFPDGKDRTFRVAKDYGSGYRRGFGYSTVLSSSLAP